MADDSNVAGDANEPATSPSACNAQTVERLGDLAKQTKDRLVEQQSHTTVNPAQPLGGARALGGPHFQPDDVQKAREAISALNHDIAQACKAVQALGRRRFSWIQIP